MRISIVTPSYNQARFIERTIDSVLNQNLKSSDFEHIVIDGGSSDGTVEILKKYSHLKWISEKDNGQSDAINKGFKLATGDVFCWLNSDDYFTENTLSTVMDFFLTHPSSNILYGDIEYVDINGEHLSYDKGNVISFNKLISNPDKVRQPSTFWRKEVWERTGGVRTDLRVVMDLDFFLRALAQYEIEYLPQVLSSFRTYAENKTSSLRKIQFLEMTKVLKQYSESYNPTTIKFLFGRFLDSLPNDHVINKVFSRLRK